MNRLEVIKKRILLIIKFFSILALGLTSVLLLYLLFGVVLSLIPSNHKFRETPEDEISIYLLSNGVHLDVVVPLINPYKDWRHDLKIPIHIEDRAHLVGFGWGDREFYLNTPEWSDLNLPTAFNALFRKDSSAMHISYFNTLIESNRIIKVHISNDQYMKLVDFIENSFLRNEYNQTLLIEHEGYNRFDQFYEAKRSYFFFYTCNTWSNQALNKSGLRSCLWTPFDKGILWQYRKK